MAFNFFLKITIILLAGSLPPLASHAQIFGPVSSPFRSIEENTVSVMAAFGDTLWVGPGLNRNINNSPRWLLPEGADSVVDGRGRVYSLSLSKDTVLAGLGFTDRATEGGVQTGLGYHVSTDGGTTWAYLSHPLEGERDTVFTYGGTTYSKLPVTVPQQSPPFSAAHRGDVILSANWASGLVRSPDFGAGWERLVLPPFSADSLVPENTYRFEAEGDNRYDPRFDQNLLAFAVLIDAGGRVWTGTAGGLNISSNALSASADSIRWRHLKAGTPSTGGLLGNWIIDIAQQPSTGHIWMTNWPAGLHADEQFGIVRTTDAGTSFDRYLIGKKINDLAFKGDHVVAAGDDGVYLSPDNGSSWQRIEQIESANTFIKKSAGYLSAAATSGMIWVGSTDGLATSPDLGKSWRISRVDFPLSGGNQYRQSAPDVSAYAYPSPFSPRRHGIVRIKFEVAQSGTVRVRLFDFAMNLVKEIQNGLLSPGTYEAVWDGSTRTGRQVANGPVLYQIDTPGKTIRGKLLVIN